MLLRKPPQKGFEKEKSMRSWKWNFVVSLLVGFALGLFVWVAAAIIAGVITNQLVWSGTWTSYDPYSGVPPGTPVPLEYFEPFYWAGLPFHVAFSTGTGSIIAM